MRTYFGAFTGSDDIVAEFGITSRDLDDTQILIADYQCEDFEGVAFVLFRRDGKLYEVHGSHCSCHGLQDQWEPQEATLEALRMRRFTWLDQATKQRWKELIE